MDQPNGNEDKELQNTTQDGVMPQDNGTDNATPVNVTVQSDDDSQVTDPVLDGVPSSGEPVEVAVEVPSVETAEEIVAEALPQSTADELAAVASELESMATSGTPVDQAQPSPSSNTDTYDNDPMQQIMQEANESTESVPYTEPPESSDDMQDEPVSIDEPTTAQSESAEESVTSDTDQGSMETENEYGERTAPVTDNAQSAEPSMPTEPVSSQESVTETDNEAQDSPIEAPDLPAEENPVNEEVSNEQNSPVAMEVSEAPASETESPVVEMEESAVEASAVNEVVTPSVVSAAIAAGTSGENAITGSPEARATDAEQPPQQQPAVPKQKSSKVMIVVVVALVTLLFGGGAVAAYMMQPEESEDTNTSVNSDSDSDQDTGDETNETATAADTASPGEKVEAKALDDYKAACSKGGMVTNATVYGGDPPHPVVVFEKGSDEKFAQSLISFKDTTWSAVASKVAGGQLVTCIARKSGTEVKLKNCPITDSVTKVTADVAFHSSKYTVDLYEASTGKMVNSFENSSISTACPTNAVYNKADPKIYAVFDQVALETSLSPYVTADSRNFPKN